MQKDTLWSLKKGECGIVTAIHAKEDMRRRFYEIGCIEGARIRMIGIAPLGDPKAYAIADAMIAIRKEDAQTIEIRLESR